MTSDLESSVQSAIANERQDNERRQTKRALIGVFVVIPIIVLGAVGVWLLIGRM